MVGDGFGDANNAATGAEVWRTPGGTDWVQVNADGFGDSHNYSMTGTAACHDHLFLGTRNRVNGGKVWMTLHQVYLPAVLRD